MHVVGRADVDGVGLNFGEQVFIIGKFFDPIADLFFKRVQFCGIDVTDSDYFYIFEALNGGQVCVEGNSAAADDCRFNFVHDNSSEISFIVCRRAFGA